MALELVSIHHIRLRELVFEYLVMLVDRKLEVAGGFVLAKVVMVVIVGIVGIVGFVGIVVMVLHTFVEAVEV